MPPHKQKVVIIFIFRLILLTSLLIKKFAIENIGEALVEQLILDLQIDETKAADIFYSSATFGQLANPDTEFYKKTWQEIFKILKSELIFFF